MIVFFGSSDFSIEALKACLASRFPVGLVITTPDRPKGRGLKLQPAPVRLFCEQNKISFVAPEKLKDEALITQVKSLNPDFFVVSSYGKIIPASWLSIPKQLSLNVHPSFLPKYRGASPLNWPILNGDAETGISIAEVTPQLDAGDIFYQKRIPLTEQMDSESLSVQLAELSREALACVFSKIETRTLSRMPQAEAASTYARKLTKEDGLIDWKKSAAEISRLVRGLLPWPGAYALFQGDPILILKARIDSSSGSSLDPGQVSDVDKKIFLKIQTGEGVLAIESLRPAGKKDMSGADFARGRRLLHGSSFA